MPFFDENGDPIIAPMALLYEPPNYPRHGWQGTGDVWTITMDGKLVGHLTTQGRPPVAVVFRSPLNADNWDQFVHGNDIFNRLRHGALYEVPLPVMLRRIKRSSTRAATWEKSSGVDLRDWFDSSVYASL